MKKFIFTLTIVLGILSANAQTPSARDKKFAETAAADNLKEIRLGELAQTNASSAEVKNFGQKMITDHTKANNELKALASRKNISVPTSLDNKGQKCVDKLSKKQGKDFDKAFAKKMAKDHKKAVALFKKESDKGDDTEIKSFAQRTLPTLENHREMANNLCKTIK